MKYLILENIRSAYNVGAIFRTADAANVHRIFLVGHTPTPLDRFGRVQPEIEKTSLGASATVPWEYSEHASTVISRLQHEGVTVVAIEQSQHAQILFSFVEPSAVAYIFGHEVDGVTKETLAQADMIVDIPMLGKKESLNVSVAAGIVLYHGLETQ